MFAVELFVKTLGAAGDLRRIRLNDEELPAELLDICDPPAQTVEMAAQAITVGIAQLVLSLELPELKPQTIELDAKPIAGHAFVF